jgi:uncharacterized protein YdbL (DUF1318 family)
MSPTVNIATQKPIEIKIDLHHEVRIQLDREVSELIDSEGTQALTARSVAEDVDRIREGKARGTLGEQANGYLGVRSVRPADADTVLVDRVNAARRDEYRALAEKKELPQDAIEKLAGARRLDAASPGEAVQTPEGKWIEKDENTTVVVTNESDG